MVFGQGLSHKGTGRKDLRESGLKRWMLLSQGLSYKGTGRKGLRESGLKRGVVSGGCDLLSSGVPGEN